MNIEQEDYDRLDDGSHRKHFHEMDENHTKDFSSVQKMVKLPNMKQLQPEENLFPPVQKQLVNSQVISEGLKETMILLRQQLRTEFKTFQNPKQFKFQFPESKFPPVEPGKRNLISYEQKNIVQEEDTFRDKLSSEQIQQIAENGQFKVKSNHEYITLPYVWKINDTLFRGRKNVQQAWQRGIANAHACLTRAKRVYSTEIPNQLKKISKLPMRFFSLFFGKKSMKTVYKIDYHRQVGKDFWNEVLEKYYVKSSQWGSYLFDYLDAQYKAEDHMTITCQDFNDNQQNKKYEQRRKQQQKSRKEYNQRVNQKEIKKQKINHISDQFERKWTKSKKKVFEQVSRQYQQEHKTKQKSSLQKEEVGSSQNDILLMNEKQKTEEEQQEILQKFSQKKFTLYTEFLQKKLPTISVPDNVISSLVSLLTIMQIITQKQRNLQRKLRKQKQKIQEEIKRQHRVLSYDYEWYQGQLERRYKPIEERVNTEFYNKFVDLELTKRLSMKQKETYLLWLEYRAKYDVYVEAKKRQFPEVQQPSRTFYTTYLLLPPFKIVKRTNGSYQWYEMIRTKQMQINTGKNFWKVDLYLMRVKSWTMNCLVFLAYNCWKGPFGLRCLWGTIEFDHNQTINSQTGEIINEKRKTVILVFRTVLQGMKKSRQHFQSLPDRGLFGKNFSRYFNYVECYVFRFAIVGVLITLVLYPIAIVLQSILMFVLVLTVWLWMPIVLLVTYLFNTLLFQFQSSYVPYGFFVRSAPTPSLFLSLLQSIIKILWILIFSFVISPLLSCMIALWTYICKGFRTVADSIMLFLIRKLGRTPSRNTAIAKKISGPGMSKQYYMSINQQDVYILVQSQLQQIFMRQFNRIYNEKINVPVERFNQVMRLFIGPYVHNQYYSQFSNNSLIVNNVNQLRTLYNKSYYEYMNRYPSRPYNIRFTQEQIDSYFENTVKIVHNFVTKQGIESWIFDQYDILHEDYEQLTRKVWMTVFSCGEEIFQPLQKIDQRFKLEDMYKDSYYGDGSTSFGGGSMKKNVHKVMEALEGEIELKPRKANISAYKHTLLHKQLSSVRVRQVLNRIENNSQERVYFSTTETKPVFFPHLAIKQVIKRDKHEYELQAQKYSKARV